MVIKDHGITIYFFMLLLKTVVYHDGFFDLFVFLTDLFIWS